MVVLATNIGCFDLQHIPGEEVALDSGAAPFPDPVGRERNRFWI